MGKKKVVHLQNKIISATLWEELWIILDNLHVLFYCVITNFNSSLWWLYKIKPSTPPTPCTWFCIGDPVVFSELHPQSLKPYVHRVKRAPIVGDNCRHLCALPSPPSPPSIRFTIAAHVASQVNLITELQAQPWWSKCLRQTYDNYHALILRLLCTIMKFGIPTILYRNNTLNFTPWSLVLMSIWASRLENQAKFVPELQNLKSTEEFIHRSRVSYTWHWWDLWALRSLSFNPRKMTFSTRRTRGFIRSRAVLEDYDKRDVFWKYSLIWIPCIRFY